MIGAPVNSSAPDAKVHYEVLDGLRGIAALLVVAFHIFEPNSNGIRFKQTINHGYLAVDFFFLLSGFVVAYAYDDRWLRMNQWEFYKRRLIRLQPMAVLGSFFGASLYYLGRGDAFPLIATTPIWKLFLVLLLSCTLLPLPYRFDIRGWYEMHPLNGPSWSLFYEYIANILYALCLRKLSKRWLIVSILLAAAFLAHMLLTGQGDVGGGWSLSVAQLHIGFARLFFPFLAGMLLMRSGWRLRVRHSFVLCTALLVLSMILPRFGGPNRLWINGLYEAFCIIVLFPLIVAMGAGHQGSLRVNGFCRRLGDLSYPLYITHDPLIYLYTAWMWRGPHTLSERTGWGVLLWVTAMLFGYASLKIYDEPVRAWLSRRFLHMARSEATLHVTGADPAFPKP